MPNDVPDWTGRSTLPVSVQQAASGAAGQGTTSVPVQDSTQYTVGGFIVHQVANGAQFIYRVAGIIDAMHLRIDNGLTAAITQGDLIAAVPFTVTDSRKFIANQRFTTQPAANSACTINVPALAFHTITVCYIRCTAQNQSNNAHPLSLTVWQGAIGTGVKKLVEFMFLPAGVGQQDRFDLKDVGFNIDPGSDMNVDLTVPSVDYSATLNVGSYYQF